MAMKFDPMTGEPINNVPKFDPMTGKPITNDAPQFDPTTGQQVYVSPGKKPNKNKGLIIGAAVVVAVALIGAVGFLAVTSGLFLSAPNKVLLATYNTFTEENAFAENLNVGDLFEKKELTTEVSVSIDDADVEMKFLTTKNEKQVDAIIDISGYPEIEAVAGLDEEYLKLQIPSISDEVFGYNYVEEKTGYLADNLDDEYLDMMDDALATIYSGYNKEENEEFSKAVADVFKEEYKTLEFEKVDKETYEVNGKDVKCKGYETTISEDFMINVIEGIGDIVYDYYGDEIDDVLYMDNSSWHELVDEMVYSVEGMPDLDITFYIYKNKLACLVMDAEGSELEILFLGGDTRTQNMEINIDDETIMEVEGGADGSEEYMTVSSYGTDVIDISYDSKEGDYSIEIAEEIYMEGIIEASKKEFRMDIDELVIEGMDVGSVSIYVHQGAELLNLDDEMLDIGNASEGELLDFVLEYSELFEYMY